MGLNLSAVAVIELSLGVFILAAGSSIVIRPRLARRLRRWRSPRSLGLCCLAVGGSVSAAGIGDVARSVAFGIFANIVGLLFLVVAAVVAHVCWPYRGQADLE